MTLLHGIAVAARHIIKNKVSAFINLVGLAIGLTGFTCIMLYVEHETSFDKFHTGYANTYRVVKDFVTADGASVPDATTPPALSKALRTELEEVEAVTRLNPARGRLFLIQYEDQKFYETKLISVDQGFFDVFNFSFVGGSKENALKEIHSIIMTESTAKKYFGDSNPVGKVVKMNINGGTEYTVSAVLNDVPTNSHFSFDLIIPFESRRDPDVDWQRSGFYTYARLKEGVDPSVFLSNVKSIFKKNVPNSLDEYHVQRLEDIHLHSNLKMELSSNGSADYLRILVLIGIFTLLIACINYVNLTTAQSSRRAKEVAVRKSIGAVRSQLIRQFLTESLVTVCVAVLISLFITSIILPFLAPVTGVDLSGLLFHSQVIMWCGPFILLLAFIAGFYPALYLSGFQPLKIFRKNFTAANRGGGLRKSLVVLQFAISSALIAATLIISGQLNFMKQKDLGFSKENILLVPNVRGGIGGENAPVGSWDNDVRQLADVVSFSRADGILGSTNAVNGVTYPATNTRVVLNFIRIDHDFVPTMQIRMKEGRNFSRDFISDTTAIILNEQAVRQLGLTEPVIGQRLAWDDDAGKTRDVTIVGVARDFHFTDLHSAIMPFGFILEENNGSNFFIKINSDNLQNTLISIGKIWDTYNPGKPFLYSFQDEYIARHRISDERFEILFSVFTIQAIVIACLGLFGLTIFLAESRRKEIGIRKIMGASIISLLRLLSRESVIMIILAMTIAFPSAYFMMNNWLLSFAYHISIGWQVFIVAGIASMLMAVLTISFHAVKVALGNPVDSLRAD